MQVCLVGINFLSFPSEMFANNEMIAIINRGALIVEMPQLSLWLLRFSAKETLGLLSHLFVLP